MKYLVRALKYYISIVCLLAVVLTVLSLLHLTGGNIDTMFRNGADSIWQIALMFLAVSLFYPRFGYCKRRAAIPGEYGEIRNNLIDFMESRRYRLEKEDGENLTFRAQSPVNRLFRMYEDRITLTRELGGFCVEGLTKDVVRLVNGLEYRFRSPED